MTPNVTMQRYLWWWHAGSRTKLPIHSLWEVALVDVSDFYDDYVPRQVSVGINDRHRSILGLLVRFGLRPHHHVLEIGSGVGTVTELIADALDSAGSVTGIDISPKSIEIARRRLGNRGNVTLISGNILEVEVTDRFDVVVL